MKNLKTVIAFTIKDMLKRKAFIIGTLIIMAIIILGFNVPRIIKAIFGEDTFGNTKLLIVDSQNIFEGNLDALKEADLGYDIQISNDKIEFEQIKEKIENGETEEAIIITQNEGVINMQYIVENLQYVEKIPEEILSMISSVYTNNQIAKLGLTEEELVSITPNFNIELSQTEEQEVKGNNFVMMILSMVLFIAIYYAAYQVSSSITTEKTSKIIETLVTSTSPKVIVLGKTIGIGLVGLAQILLFVVTAVISAVLFLEPGSLDGIIDLSVITPYLAIISIIYFVLGYSFYSLLYALTGSTVSKPEDIQSANGPVAVIAVIGFYLAYFTMMSPTSNLNEIAAILPISSPFCMPLRIMMGLSSINEVLISIGVLILTIIIIAKISIKIYSQAILAGGSKLSLKDIIKMTKNKNI